MTEQSDSVISPRDFEGLGYIKDNQDFYFENLVKLNKHLNSTTKCDSNVTPNHL